MVRAAVDGVDVLEASDLEIRRGGDTFTVDTIAELRSQGPDDDLVLILGSDAASGLDTWERPDELRRTCGWPWSNVPAEPVSVPDGFRHVTVPVPQLDVSSTALRDRAAAGLSLRYLVPAAGPSPSWNAAASIVERRGGHRDRSPWPRSRPSFDVGAGIAVDRRSPGSPGSTLRAGRGDGPARCGGSSPRQQRSRC